MAIAHLINKNELINAVLNGKGIESLGPSPKGVWYYNNEIEPYPYNPEKGKEILKEFGAEYLKFKIFVNSENKELELIKTAQVIQQALKDVRLQTEIRVFDWQTLRHRILEEKTLMQLLFQELIFGIQIYTIFGIHQRQKKEDRTYFRLKIKK